MSAWTIPTQVVELYIQQHSNGSTTYIDQNGQMYMPITEQLNSGIINNDINLESAFTFVAISVFLVLLGGITSGLNVALLSIDAKKNDLMLTLDKKKEKNNAIKKRESQDEDHDDNEQKMRKKIQPLINDRHLLLVTLLVANASAMEALPIFLDELVVSWLAIVISVTFVLIFGEILPQAFFSSDPLKSGYKMYYIVTFMKWILFPICKPIAFLLDLLFGKEHKVTFTRKEVEIIMMEINQHVDQQTVVEGALNIGGYTVLESIVTWNEVVCLDANTKLDDDGLRAIYKTGRSRIPIYEGKKNNIIGILLVKMLILCDPNPELTLKQYLTVNFKKVPTPSLVLPSTKLYDTINIFQAEKTHFAMVCEEKDEEIILGCWRDGKSIPEDLQWSGIITLEDIMEDIIQEDIDDEFDAINAHGMLKTWLEEHKSNWSEDQSYVESVHSRFSAKHQRTLRAKKTKSKIDNKSVKSYAITTLDDDRDTGLIIAMKGSEKPLLSVNNASINVKGKDYGTILTSDYVM